MQIGLVPLGHVTEPLGRAGIGFMEPGGAVDGLKSVLVVDPRTDSLVATELVLVQR